MSHLSTEEKYKEVFTEETYYEFIRNAQSKPRSTKNKYGCEFKSSETGGAEWSGSESLKHSFDLAINGWDAGVKQLELEEGVEVSGGYNFTPSVMGSVVNIGAYLMGEPESMYDITEEREFNLEPITIYVQLDYLADITAEQGFEFCHCIIKLVNKYQANHNVRLVGIFEGMMRGHEVRLVNHVIIKDYDSRFVLNNIAFAFHPSFFRRIYFKVMEQTDYCESGYGGGYGTKQIERRLLKGGIGTDKAILLPSLQDTRGAFEEDSIVHLN